MLDNSQVGIVSLYGTILITHYIKVRFCKILLNNEVKFNKYHRDIEENELSN